MSQLFEVRSERRDADAGVIYVSGEVDMYTAPQLKERLLDLIDGGAKRIVVDLSAVTFIDSTALGVLIGGVRRVHGAGGAMSLVVTSRAVERVLSITGLDRVFSIHSTLDEAIAALN